MLKLKFPKSFLLERAVACAMDLGDYHCVADMLLRYGEPHDVLDAAHLYQELGEPELAGEAYLKAEHLHDALACFRQAGARERELECLERLNAAAATGELLLEMGRAAEALPYLERARDGAADEAAQVRLTLHVARALHASGQKEAGMAQYRGMLERLERLEAGVSSAEAWVALGAWGAAVGRHDRMQEGYLEGMRQLEAAQAWERWQEVGGRLVEAAGAIGNRLLARVTAQRMADVAAQQAATPAAPPPDPVRAIIDAGEYGAAVEQLDPRARAGDRVAAILLAEVVETAAVPRDLRFRAAGILSAVGDPRLLDPATGDNQLMQYAAQETQPTTFILHPSRSYWCEVEAGPFWYGDDQKGNLRQKTLPYRYRIGRYPVTNAEYARFVDAGGYADRQWWTEHGWAYLQPGGFRYSDEPERITQPRPWNDKQLNAPNQPVVGVTWYEAVAYCAWLTARGRAAGWLAAGDVIRLPTSLEWERAARGTDRRRYPWGDDEPSEEYANYGDHVGKTTPIGCYPQGIAACGALDMAGQVWEWTATAAGQDDDPTPRGDFGAGERVRVRGGEYYSKAEHLFCGSRDWYYPRSGYINWGFRLLPPSLSEQ